MPIFVGLDAHAELRTELAAVRLARGVVRRQRAKGDHGLDCNAEFPGNATLRTARFSGADRKGCMSAVGHKLTCCDVRYLSVLEVKQPCS
jgi:hypothetical protein